MAFDVDEPADLAHLRRLRLKNETGRLLKSLGAASEIKV
jgi:2-phospho-L-lactate guanylyltransferase (CobY/MobA/RfbA family)